MTSIPATLVALAAAIFMTIPPIHAQDTAVDGRLLPAAVDTFTVSFRGTPIGRGIMARSRDGDTLLVQGYEWRGADGEVVTDSLFSDLRTLRSIREVRVVEGAVVRVDFGDSARTTILVDGEIAARRAEQIGAGVFSSAALEAIVGASPLAEGYATEVQLYYAPPSTIGVATAEIRVLRSETVADRSGTPLEAWVVEATTPDGATTFWIDRNSRQVLQYDVREGPAMVTFRR